MNSFRCFLVIARREMYSYNGHMNIVSSTNVRNNWADVAKIALKKEYVLVTHRGKVKTAIIDVEVLEDLLSLHDKEYLESIKRARADARAGRVYTFEEVFGNI